MQMIYYKFYFGKHFISQTFAYYGPKLKDN